MRALALCLLLAATQVDARARDLGVADIDPLFQGAAEATEEAVVNALVAAQTMTGIDGTRIYGLPHDELRAILKRYNRLEGAAK